MHGREIQYVKAHLGNAWRLFLTVFEGPVTAALALIRQLAESERVGQVFVRHTFRFWMGRNETLNDAPVLQEAWKAYHDSGGSMNALITSLVTSDAFLYRTRED